MNLRVVHAALILLSAILAVVVGIWCLDGYRREREVLSLAAAIASFAASLGLVIYDSWFLKKTRMIR